MDDYHPHFPTGSGPNKDYFVRLMARATRMARFDLLGCYDYGTDPLGLRNVTTSKGQEFFRDLTANQVVAEHGGY